MAEMNREPGLGNTYYFEGTITDGALLVRLPRVTPTRYLVSEVAWQSNGTPSVYGTLSEDPTGQNAIWDQIEEKQAVNTAVTALKFVSESADKVVVRVIFR